MSFNQKTLDDKKGDEKDDKVVSRSLEIKTSYGPMVVTVEGDPTNQPVLLTYHDVGLNHISCFNGWLHWARIQDGLFSKFCVVHIDVPGHQFGAGPIDDGKEISLDVLTELITRVMSELNFKTFIGFGVGAGGYILTNYATANPDAVLGLVLMGMTVRKAGLWEKGKMMLGRLGESFFLERWFSEVARSLPDTNHSSYFARMNQTNVAKFVAAFQARTDISDQLSKIKCHCILFVSDGTALEEEGSHMFSRMPSGSTEYIHVGDCGVLITEEAPSLLLKPMLLYFNGLGIFTGRRRDVVLPIHETPLSIPDNQPQSSLSIMAAAGGSFSTRAGVPPSTPTVSGGHGSPSGPASHVMHPTHVRRSSQQMVITNAP